MADDENQEEMHDDVVKEEVPVPVIPETKDKPGTPPGAAAAPPSAANDATEQQQVEGDPGEAAVAVEDGSGEPQEEQTVVVEEEPVKKVVKVYGGCEGPNSQYIQIVSSDKHVFILPREHVLTSGVMRAILGTQKLAEIDTNVVNLNEIPSHLLAEICNYFNYRAFFVKTEMAVEDFEFTVDPLIAMPLLMAANFLNC